MRNLFAWRLRPSEAEFSILWNSATFVFDTSYLLDLYRLSHRTTEDHLKVLKHIQGRIWLPYQVADEFFRNREQVIESEAESFQKSLSALEDWKAERQKLNDFSNIFLNYHDRRTITAELKIFFNGDNYLDEQKNYLDAIDKLEQVFREKIEQIESAHFPLSADDDSILESILSLFESKVGQSSNKEDVQSLHKEAEDRYSRSIPPGFKDAKRKKDDRQYGDFLLWKEILNFAAKESKPIIFVTSEQKEDWWTKKNNEILSPHIELRREFQECVKQPFWIYRTERFLEMAKEKFKLEIDPKSIEETNAIADVEVVDEDEEDRELLRESEEAKLSRSMNYSGMSGALQSIAQAAKFGQSMNYSDDMSAVLKSIVEVTKFNQPMNYSDDMSDVLKSIVEATKFNQPMNYSAIASVLQSVVEATKLSRSMSLGASNTPQAESEKPQSRPKRRSRSKKSSESEQGNEA